MESRPGACGASPVSCPQEALLCCPSLPPLLPSTSLEIQTLRAKHWVLMWLSRHLLTPVACPPSSRVTPRPPAPAHPWATLLCPRGAERGFASVSEASIAKTIRQKLPFRTFLL